jgi:hypothetical protein
MGDTAPRRSNSAGWWPCCGVRRGGRLPRWYSPASIRPNHWFYRGQFLCRSGANWAALGMLKRMGRNRNFGILGTGASESGLKPGNEGEGTVALWELLWGAAGGAIGAYGSSYFGKAGELAAIRGGLDTIKLQVTATAEATKAVEQRFSRADLVGSAEFEFRRQQLTELYGPLYATLKTTKELYDLWMAHKIPEVNGPFKLLLAAKNKMSRDLITQKAYLIEGGRMPESFNRFYLGES